MVNEGMVDGSLPQHRGARVVAAILDAAVEEVSEKGYSGFSIEAVAERAHVNKTTVYRRWPTKQELLFDTLSREGELLFDLPNSGSLFDDLFLLTKRLSTFVRTTRGRALYLLWVEQGAREGDIRFPQANARSMHDVIRRGIDRGELLAGTDVDLFALVLGGAVLQASVVGRRQITEVLLKQVISLVVAGSQGISARDGVSTPKAVGKRKPQRGSP
jgi:AcrR family transcriptional regulator